MMVALPAMLPLVAMIVVAPSATPVTTPDDASTDAIVEFALDHVTVRPVSTCPRESASVAVACECMAAAMLTLLSATVIDLTDGAAIGLVIVGDTRLETLLQPEAAGQSLART